MNTSMKECQMTWYSALPNVIAIKVMVPAFSVMSDSFGTPWTIALSMGFPRQEYWSGLSFPFPGALPDPGVEPTSPALAGRFFTTEPLGSPLMNPYQYIIIN